MRGSFNIPPLPGATPEEVAEYAFILGRMLTTYDSELREAEAREATLVVSAAAPTSVPPGLAGGQQQQDVAFNRAYLEHLEDVLVGLTDVLADPKPKDVLAAADALISRVGGGDPDNWFTLVLGAPAWRSLVQILPLPLTGGANNQALPGRIEPRVTGAAARFLPPGMLPSAQGLPVRLFSDLADAPDRLGAWSAAPDSPEVHVSVPFSALSSLPPATLLSAVDLYSSMRDSGVSTAEACSCLPEVLASSAAKPQPGSPGRAMGLG